MQDNKVAGDGGNPYKSPELDYQTVRKFQRRKRRHENILLGTGVALFAFVLYWLPGIFQILIKAIFG